MLFERAAREKLLALSEGYPVLTVLGPRQSGKTTLVKNCFPRHHYVNLEKPDVRALIEADPNAFFASQPNGIILDEIQQAPILLSYIQVLTDENPLNGRFILTGSHQLSLQQALTQSLAGRTAILQLLPLTMGELQQADRLLPTNELMLQGFYPRIYQQQLNPVDVYQYYYQTYIERDVRQMINIKDLNSFQRFVKLCAGRIGQVLNFSNLANEVGVSHHTIKSWLSILQASFLIILLPPYFENFGKRNIKSPKLYFTDVGLAAYLLEIETIGQIDRDPLRGQLFENMVVIELYKTRLNQGREPHLYFYRDSQGHEVDVIYKQGATLMPIEIKSSQTFTTSFNKNLKYFSNLVGDRCQPGYIIYAGSDEMKSQNFSLITYTNSARIIY